MEALSFSNNKKYYLTHAKKRNNGKEEIGNGRGRG